MPICIFAHLKSVLKLDTYSQAALDTWKNNDFQKMSSGFYGKNLIGFKRSHYFLAI